MTPDRIIDNWAVTDTHPNERANAYQAPEHQRKYVFGYRRSDGKAIMTSYIKDVRGRIISTASGSLYELGTISPGYLEYMKNNRIQFSWEEPIQFKRSNPLTDLGGKPEVIHMNFGTRYRYLHGIFIDQVINAGVSEYQIYQADTPKNILLGTASNLAQAESIAKNRGETYAEHLARHNRKGNPMRYTLKVFYANGTTKTYQKDVPLKQLAKEAQKIVKLGHKSFKDGATGASIEAMGHKLVYSTGNVPEANPMKKSEQKALLIGGGVVAAIAAIAWYASAQSSTTAKPAQTAALTGGRTYVATNNTNALP
jgi:hypothetical protein